VINAFDPPIRIGEIADYENLLAGVKLASLRIWMRSNESITESMSRKNCSTFYHSGCASESGSTWLRRVRSATGRS